jgi:peptidoglycan/LPS O-acetylase OafA/YrhL
VEGLRAVAVILVVAYHAGVMGFGAGFVGVDVFFTLSGYLITSLIVREFGGTGGFDFVGFYARRARRLLPAAAVMFFVVLGVAAVELPPLEQFRISRAAIPVAAYAGNIFFLREATNYFAPGITTNPLLHTWSLAVEEQFYLIWPVFIAIAFGRARSPRRLVWFMAILSAGSLLAFIGLIPRHRSHAFYGIYARAWEFGAGGLACLVPVEALDTRRRWLTLLAAASLLLIVGSAIRVSPSSRYFGPVTLLAVVGTAGILTAGAAGPEQIISSPLLGNRVMQLFGRTSYSWYLWHWPVIVFAERIASPLPLYGQWLCVFVSLGCAIVSYRLVEKPVRFSGYLMKRPGLSLSLGFALMVAGIGSGVIWRRVAMANPQYEKFARVAEDTPRVYELGCRATDPEGRLRDCVFGNPASPTTLVLFGDSHAAQWFTPIEELVNQNSWRLVTLLRADCPGISPHNISESGVSRVCAEWQKAAAQRIISMQPNLVILGSAGQLDVRERGDTPARFSYSAWQDATRATLGEFGSRHIKTLLLRDTPSPGFDVPTCLARMAWTGTGRCSFPRQQALDEKLFRLETEAAQGLSGVTVADLSDQICAPTMCEAADNGVVVYRDPYHLTDSFAKTRFGAMSAWIEAALRFPQPRTGDAP